MEVAPARTRGARVEPPTILQRGAAEEIAGAAAQGVGFADRTAWPAARAAAAPATSPTSPPTSPTRSGRP
jgi:hypothetical protein